MILFRRYKNVIALLLILATGALHAVPDSLVYRIKDKEGMHVNTNGVELHINMDTENSGLWVFSPADNYKFALRNYDDSGWKNVNSDFETEKDTFFHGLGWFRLHYKVSQKEVDATLMLSVSQNGASEVFCDGKLLKKFGHVSADLEKEVTENYSENYFPLITRDTLEHIIAVRYSNSHAKQYLKRFDNADAGFKVRILRNDEVPVLQEIVLYTRYVCIGVAMFLLALSVVHLIIFLFERSRKFNLYQSIFVCCLSLLFLTDVVRSLFSDPAYKLAVSYYGGILLPTFFISILALLYNLFERKLNAFFYISLIVYVCSIIVRYFINEDLGDAFNIALFCGAYFGSTVLSIKALRRNFRGAKIVGLGVLGSTIFIILAIVVIIMEMPYVSVLCLGFSILSLPFSMSVYLAYDFAKANETLKTQIVQIKELSDKALKDEAEKKQILENQNQMLETQVKERTAEITAQKEVIEEKNKDITDSINYAKRIQDATLVSKEIKYKLFPNAFVLFKPKDIVSGDFYWFAGKDGKRLISVCDCTGHGVPGALMSMIGNNLLNKVVNEKSVTSPDKILIELDKELRLTLKKDENPGAKDGMDVALLSFKNENELEYAGANRPLWIIREGQLEEIKATKISIGGDRYGAEIQFQRHEVKLQKGDTVYISSDGFADQFNNADKKLMTRRFKEILLSIQHLSMSEQEKYLDDFIEKWKGGLEQTDDILVIGVRV